MNAMLRIDPQSGEPSMTRPDLRREWRVDLQSGLAVSAAWGEVEFRPLPDGSIRIDAIRPADASVDPVELIRRAMIAIAGCLNSGSPAPGRHIH